MANDKRDNIMKLLKINNVLDNINNAISMMIESQFDESNDINATMRQKLKDGFAGSYMLDTSVEAYDKYYTDEDICVLLEFYGTETGQKMILIEKEITESLSVAMENKIIEVLGIEKE